MPFPISMYSNDIFHDNTMYKQVKPGFTNYQPQPKYSWALSKIEGKGELGKCKDLWKRSEKLYKYENLEVAENLKNHETRKILKPDKFWKNLKPEKFWKSGRFWKSDHFWKSFEVCHAEK